MNRPAGLDEALAKLRQRFAATSRDSLAAFDQLADRLERTPSGPEIVEALERDLHRMHGTAGSYGFHEAGRLADAMELLATRWRADAQRDLQRRSAIVRQFVHALAGALGEPRRGPGPSFRHRVLLIDVVDDLAASLVAEALHRGHAVERATSGGLPSILDQREFGVLIAWGSERPTAPEGLPVVLLASGVLTGDLTDDRTGDSARTAVRLIDPTADPREIIQVAESMADANRRGERDDARSG